MKQLIIAISMPSLLLASSVNADGDKVPYPQDYRNWTHVKSMVIEPGHPLENPFQGIHHVYANNKAIAGLSNGRYPDGAVFVFDLLNYDHADKTIQESDRKLIGVMHKNARKYSSTGGWGFEGFSGNSETLRLTTDGGASCFGCHSPQKEADYVFSRYRN
jgi:hypothetical protein